MLFHSITKLSNGTPQSWQVRSAMEQPGPPSTLPATPLVRAYCRRAGLGTCALLWSFQTDVSRKHVLPRPAPPGGRDAALPRGNFSQQRTPAFGWSHWSKSLGWGARQGRDHLGWRHWFQYSTDQHYICRRTGWRIPGLSQMKSMLNAALKNTSQTR